MSSMARENRALTGDRNSSGKAGSMRSLPENAVVAAGLLFFVLAWTLHGAVVESHKALHFDLLEAYAWGQEFQLGYNQHGPFWAWIAGAWFLLFPKTNASFVLLEAINAALGLLGAWRLIGLFAKDWTRHAATLLLLATPFYTYMAYKYNANTILISLWPWTLFFFVSSLDNLSKRDAVWFGVFAALSILSKYYTVILLMTCAFSLYFHPNGRRYLLSPLPWLAAAVFTVLVLPHLIWSLNSNAPPVAYAMSITGNGWSYATGYAVRFVLEAVLYEAGVAAIVFLAWRLSKAGGIHEVAGRLPQSRRSFLAVLVLTPAILTLIFGLSFQLKIVTIMAAATYPLMPLLLLQFAPPLDARRLFQLAGSVAIAVTVLAAASSPLEREVMDRRSRKGPGEPNRELAARVTGLWHNEIRTPLRYAGGAIHYANGLAFYSEDHPSSFPGLSFSKARWVTPDKLKRYGLLIVCPHVDTDCLGKAAGFVSGASKQMSIAVSRTMGTRPMPEVQFDIVMIPPQGG